MMGRMILVLVVVKLHLILENTNSYKIKIMKNIIILFLVSVTTNVIAQWNDIIPVTKNNYNGTYFIQMLNNKDYFLRFNYRTITNKYYLYLVKSSNSGQDWDTLILMNYNFNDTVGIYGVIFFSPDSAIIFKSFKSAMPGKSYITTDGFKTSFFYADLPFLKNKL